MKLEISIQRLAHVVDPVCLVSTMLDPKPFAAHFAELAGRDPAAARGLLRADALGDDEVQHADGPPGRVVRMGDAVSFPEPTAPRSRRTRARPAAASPAQVAGTAAVEVELHLAQHGAATFDDLLGAVDWPADVLTAALELLRGEGKLRQVEGDGEPVRYSVAAAEAPAEPAAPTARKRGAKLEATGAEVDAVVSWLGVAGDEGATLTQIGLALGLERNVAERHIGRAVELGRVTRSGKAKGTRYHRAPTLPGVDLGGAS